MSRHPARNIVALIGVMTVIGTFALVPGSAIAAPTRQTFPSDPAVRGPIVGEPVTPAVFDGSLKSLPKAPGWRPGDPVRYVPLGPPKANDVLRTREPRVTRGERGSGIRGPLAPTGALFTTPEVSFDGINFTGFRPPDTNGDVGPNHYIQSVNASFAVFDKQGTVLSGPNTIRSLFSAAPVTPSLPAGSLCRTTNRGDPVVLYDPIADRWLISQFSFALDAGNNPILPFSQCIAISQTANPVSGGFFLYEFLSPNAKFPDYPKYGVWPDAYYMTTNQFGGTGGGGAYAFDRANMLAGNAATQIYFDTTERNMLPSDLDGPTPPPAGAPNHFAKMVDGAPDRIEIRDFHVDFALPANSTFSAPISISVAAFDSNMCGGGFAEDQCIPQPPPAPTTCDGTPATFGCLSSIPDRLLFRLAYRNFGSHETLVTNHTVDTGGDHAGVFWHELRLSGGAWSVFQEGVYSPDGTHRWMGSIAMDKNGGIALGYSVSSGSVFPGVRYAGRLASDPAGTLPQGEATLVDGTGSQTACQGVDLTNPPDGILEFCRGRWGDYSAMSVDPVDDCTFWYTQQYMPASGQWQTRIGAFRLCNDPPTADADGPYTTQEGTDVVLDGTGSSDPNPTDSIVSYEWDFDNDASFDDATGPTPTFDLVGQDGVFTIGLRVTDEAGDTDTDSTTVTVTNVAPSLLGVVEDSPKPENTAVTISGTASDPGWLEPDLDVTIDWGDGTPVDVVNGPDENVRPDATTAFSLSHVYGDNGVFSPQVCAIDDDTSTCTIVPVTFTNVDPTAVIDLSGATIINGVPTIIANAGDPVTFDGNSTDPGSDDLTLVWDFGDGAPSPDVTTVFLVNPPLADPPNSPSIQPRDVDDTQVHTFGEACTYVTTFSSDDDDGGHGESTANVIIQGNADDAEKHGYWKRQYGGEGQVDFTQARLECYLLIADYLSNVFNEVRDASTLAAAYDVLQQGAGGPPAKQLDRELLTALLNFANGAFGYDELVHDSDGDGVLDTSFGDVISTAEAVRLNPASTGAELLEQRDILRDVNAS